MVVQNHNLLSSTAREFVQSLKQLDLFRCKQVRAEATDFTERARLAKDKRACRPLADAADQVPGPCQQLANPIARVEFDRATSGNATPFGDRIANVFKQCVARVRIRVDKDQPVARGKTGAAIACPANLIYRLKNDVRAARAGNFCRAIGGIVIANNGLKFPMPRRNGVSRREDALQRGREEFLLVESRYDDGDLHAVVAGKSIARQRILSGRTKRLTKHLNCRIFLS